MGQRVLVAIPELYARALNARPSASQGTRQGGAAGDRKLLPAPSELGVEVSVELALLDRMPVGLGIYDRDGGLVHSNPCFLRLVAGGPLSSGTGPPERWTGYRTDGRPFPVRDLPWARAMRGETVSPGIDLLHANGDGQSRWLNVSAAPILDPADDAIVGMVLLLLDTHDQVKPSTFAAEASRSFEQFAEQSSTAIWIADAVTQDFSYRNPLHLAMSSGMTRGIAGLDEWLEQVWEADRGEVRRRYALVRQGSTERFEYRLPSPPGAKVRIVEETCFPIFDAAHNVTSLGGLASEKMLGAQAIVYFVGDVVRSAAPPIAVGGSSGQRAKHFDSLAAFAGVADFLTPGCVIIDLCAIPDEPEDLDRALAGVGRTMPIILIGRSGTTVETAVLAMRNGAADYLVPPLTDELLAGAIRRASTRLLPAAETPCTVGHERGRVTGLPPREREVLNGLIGGGTNKSIARNLAISPRTVELYRARLMERMNVSNLAELLHAVHRCGVA
ncbi:MAG: putative response regulator with unusual domain prganization: Domain: CheY-like, partial [Sphingomonas bacterium]|nr:putative response regulator with unusual domain prganization: Domain: CheY-like [Sphingomonas bacterium]